MSYTNPNMNQRGGGGYMQQGTAGFLQYKNLGAYNKYGSVCSGGISPPVPTTNVTGMYIVPAYSAPGYSTLQHGNSNCNKGSNYFQIGPAYGYGAGNCQTQYMGSICQ